MSKIVPMELIKEAHGKICQHSDFSFVKRGRTQFTQKICDPSTKPASTDQTAVRNLFKTTWAAVDTALKDSAQKAQYEKAFKGQQKYQSLRGYVFAKLWEEAGYSPSGD